MRSNRCNPIHPDFMTDIADAYESAYTILLNLNKTWIQKQGDFFVESPYYPVGRYYLVFENLRGWQVLHLPHAIEFLTATLEDIFPILTSYRELERNYLAVYGRAWKGGRRTSSKVG